MASKLTLLSTLALLACMVVAASASAIGIGARHAVSQPQRAATASLIASSTQCPQVSLSAPVEAQEQAMLCMTNFARANAGLGALTEASQLDESAQSKAEDVLRCDSFSHFACGRDFTYWIRATGYLDEDCWHAGENLAWGSGEYGTVRSIFRAWMSSPTHRHNILGDYNEVGIALLSGDLEGHPGARVWAAHFGSRCQD